MWCLGLKLFARFLAPGLAGFAACTALGCGPTVAPRAFRALAPNATAHAAETRDPLDGQRILDDAKWLCSPEFAGRGSYQPGGVLAAKRIEAELKALGLEVSRQDVGGGALNIIAIKRGVSPRAVIVSAHYDHLGLSSGGEVFLGADDNASGTAVLLAMARALADEPIHHTLVFAAFGAEEAGLVGSGVYVQKPAVPLADTIAIVNFDMVGRNFFESGAGTPDTAAVVGIDDVVGAREAALNAAKRVKLTLIEAPPRLLELFRLENRTDDWWFRRVGVAAIHFSTGLHDDYHQVTDTPEKLVPSQLEKVARVSTALVRFLSKK